MFSIKIKGGRAAIVVRIVSVVVVDIAIGIDVADVVRIVRVGRAKPPIISRRSN